jgi:hypothetical protein
MLDPELFPALNTVIPSGGQEIVPVPAGTDPQLESINDIDSRLISDLVANIRDPKAICAQYGITPEDVAKKMRHPLFAAHYRETARFWNSDMNAQQRIRAKAAFLLEDTLPSLHKIATGAQVPVNAKLAAIEQLTKISTVAVVPKEQQGGGEKHSITINIGAGKQPIVIEQEKS